MEAEIGRLHRCMVRAASEDARWRGRRHANLEEARRQLSALSTTLSAHFGFAVPVPAAMIDLPGLEIPGGFAVIDPMRAAPSSVAHVLALAFRPEARPDADTCRLLRCRANLRLLMGLVVGVTDCGEVEELHRGSPHTCSAALLSEFAGIIELET